MSEHDITPDPVDAAYVQAEALLDDEATRAARRARVLAAVAEAGAEPAPTPRRVLRGHGRWLAAASVAGIGLLVGLKFYQPAQTPQPPAPPPAVAAAQAPAAAVDAAAPTVAVPAPSSPVAEKPVAGAPAPILARAPAPAVDSVVVTGARKEEAPAPAQPSRQFAAAPPPPPPPPPPPRAIPAPTGALAKPQADSSVAETVVTSERRAEAVSGLAAKAAPRAAQDAVPGTTADKAVSLRAAAAAGRTSEITALLSQGAAVDDPDEAGDTALIKAVRANRPAAAGLLRRRGADLDLKNNAGQSARDIAAALGDRTMNRVLGL